MFFLWAICNIFIVFSTFSMESPDELEFYTNLIEFVKASGVYEVDQLFFEQLGQLKPNDDFRAFIELCDQYQQKCQQLSSEAEWFSQQVKGDLQPLKDKINNSPNRERYQLTIEYLNEIESSPITRRKFIETNVFDEHARHFKKRVELIQTIFSNDQELQVDTRK